MANEHQQFSLNELTEAAGVSARTVRYYIGEGLLPPPVVAGPRSYYTDDHLNRLKAIGKMKDAYLPLKEVRRRLNELNDFQIAVLGSDYMRGLTMPADAFAKSAAPPEPPLDSAAEYVDRVLNQAQPEYSEGPRNLRELERMIGMYRIPTPASVEKSMVEPEEGVSWRRIQLGDEAELIIREEAYQRNRDRIEWLTDWAKKVFR